MGVRGVHATRAETCIYFRKGWVWEDMGVHLRHFNHSHCQAVGEQSGEVGDIRETHSSTGALTSGSGKIEQPLETGNVNMLDGEFRMHHWRCSLTSLLLLRMLSRAI